MRLSCLAVAALAMSCLALPLGADKRPLLITVDDLPLAGAAPDSPAERKALVEAHLAAFARHGIRAVGLVTWANAKTAEDVQLLERWLAAGHELGNHSTRHLSLTATDVSTYRADIEAARVRLAELLARHERKPRFFRFPFLREGDTPEKLDALRAYLAETGQRNLPVTIDDQDWSFDRPWQEARKAQDAARERDVAEDYQAALRLAVRHHEQAGDELLKRQTPQILLLHANAIGAAQWPRLFDWLAREHRFVSADELLIDPVFAELPRVVARFGYGLWDRLAQVREEQAARTEVAALLAAQAAAWSAGQLEEFCSAYAEDALFVAASGLTRGRQAVLERYRAKYVDQRGMGRLALEPLEFRPHSGVEVTPLGDAVPGGVHAISVVARWRLDFDRQPPASGLTLLVLERRGRSWKIVSDASL